jgi:hypothetical protein
MTFWIAGVFPFISFMQNISPTMNGQVKEGIIANSLAFKKKKKTILWTMLASYVATFVLGFGSFF